jgi:hypothetical protein
MSDKDFASLRIQLDLNEELERKISELWKTGIEVAAGVRVKGKHLFLHAMAKLQEENGIKKVEPIKMEIVPVKEVKSLGGDWS